MWTAAHVRSYPPHEFRSTIRPTGLVFTAQENTAGDHPGGVRFSDCRNRPLPAAATAAAAAAAMPVHGLLTGGFRAEVLQLADRFPGYISSFHRFSSLKEFVG